MEELEERGYISEILIAFSLLALVAISVAVIWIDSRSAIVVFNSVLPLLGTWVGTVLAYYFSRSNFATAASAYKQLGIPSALTNMPVTAVMIEKAKIASLVTIPAGQTEASINIQTDLLSLLKPPATRIPVIDSSGAIKYIIHENTLHKFVSENAIAPPAGFNLAVATLQSLLNDNDLKRLATAFSIIPSSATLADAQAKMAETPNCEDVFVTQTGKPTDPMLGWITDATLAQHSKLTN